MTVDLHLQGLELGPDGSKRSVDLRVLSLGSLEVVLKLGDLIDLVGLDFLEGVFKLADPVWPWVRQCASRCGCYTLEWGDLPLALGSLLLGLADGTRLVLGLGHFDLNRKQVEVDNVFDGFGDGTER